MIFTDLSHFSGYTERRAEWGDFLIYHYAQLFILFAPFVVEKIAILR